MLYLYPSVSGFLQMQSSLSKKLPADRAFGSIRRARRPSAAASLCTCLGTGPAGASAREEPRFQRDCPQGGHRSHTRLRVRSPTPFWRHSPRGLHFTAQRCKALPPPSFPRTLLLLLYLFQQSVPQMRISIGFLSPSKISEHNKIRFFNWQSAAFYFIVLQQFTSLCLTGDHQNTAIVPLVVAGA